MSTTSKSGPITMANPPLERGLDLRPATPAGSWAFRRLSTALWFAISVLLMMLMGALGNTGAPTAILVAFGVFGAILFVSATVVSLYRALHDAVSLVGRKEGPASVGTGQAVVLILGNLLMAGFGMLVAYFATFSFSRGRQLRRFGRVLLPSLRSSTEWATNGIPNEASMAPPGVADQWRENAKTEHASVAAFARLTLDLMALGAPPTLLNCANQDALDEIRHAEICFSIARGFDGAVMGPAPFPEAQPAATLPQPRTLALARLAVDSLVDGALHEGVSARVIAKLAQRAEAPALRSALREIAADEGRHAAHGWAVVCWCLDEGGTPVAEALRGALRTLPEEMRSELPEPARNGDWERYGIHGHRLESEEYRATLAHVTERVLRRTGRAAA
jgi:hypothetical protein